MASADDLITITRLREVVGVSSSSEDATLTANRAAAISWLERRLGRCIVNRTAAVSGSDDVRLHFNPDRLHFRFPDLAGPVVLSYAPSTASATSERASTETIPVVSDRLVIDHHGIFLFPPAGRGWLEILRMVWPFPRVTANQGMAVESIDAAWVEAVGLMVRALYEGSAYDDLGENSMLKMLLTPWPPLPVRY